MSAELYVDENPTAIDKRCHACGTEDSQKPMCFRGEIWCSDTCKKFLTNQISVEEWKARKTLQIDNLR